MVIFLSLASLLFILYALLILNYWRGWRSVPSFYLPESAPGPPVTASIIIPARNEAANIGRLLTALRAQEIGGDRVEIIVVDDGSTDATLSLASGFAGVQVIQLPQEPGTNSYKKRAVELGVRSAAGELIITTDADCLPEKNWLRTLLAYYRKTGAAFIAAPVVIETEGTAISLFQSIDFMVLQGITAAAVFHKMHAMCNGANMAYRRSAFLEVNGFSGIDRIASGDDMLLMFKIRSRYPDQIFYLKSDQAIMYTRPQPSIRSFLNQRIRWASKARYYQEKNMLPVLLLVYLFNLLFPALLLAAFFKPVYGWILLAAWLGKTLVELPFFASLASFYKKRNTITLLFLFQPLHILYTILSGFLAQIGSYEWKGRKVS